MSTAVGFADHNLREYLSKRERPVDFLWIVSFSLGLHHLFLAKASAASLPPAAPYRRRTGGGGHKPSLPPVLTGATRRQRGTDQRERLRSSRPSGATDTVYRVRGPGGWDGQVGLQALQTHCAPKKPVAASELTSQEV